MKFITSSLVMALFLASGEELAGIKNQVAAITDANNNKPRFAQLESESDSDSGSDDSDEDEENMQLHSRIRMQNNMLV